MGVKGYGVIIDPIVDWDALLFTAYGLFRSCGDRAWKFDGKRWRKIKALPPGLQDNPIVNGKYLARAE